MRRLGPRTYRFLPTFGPPERYFLGYRPEDLVAGLQAMFAPESALLERTLRAMGLVGEVQPGDLEFLNYGRLQIVFRLSVRLTGRVHHFVAAVAQRPEWMGAVLREFEILERLARRHPDLVAVAYAAGCGETPEGWPLAVSTQQHFPMARCIARRKGRTRWGIYNPEPRYRFEEFPPHFRDRSGVPLDEACRRLIVASLAATYDPELGAGIGATRASGGDFLLTRDYRYEDPDALHRCWRMIAARSLVRASREEYLNLLRREFAVPARLEAPEVLDGTLKVNHKSTEAFSPETIEAGIRWGAAGWS